MGCTKSKFRFGISQVGFGTWSRLGYNSATVVIVKIKGSEQIVGGYNPFDWDLSNSYKTTTDSFIFLFTDRKNTKTAKVGYSNGSLSVGCFLDCGPIFGYYFWSRNHGSNWTVNNSYSHNYPNISIPMTGSIEVDDYEVFQINNK